MYLGKPVISFRHADKVRTSVIHHGTSHKARAEANTLMDEVFESLGPSNVARSTGAMSNCTSSRTTSSSQSFLNSRSSRARGRLKEGR